MHLTPNTTHTQTPYLVFYDDFHLFSFSFKYLRKPYIRIRALRHKIKKKKSLFYVVDAPRCMIHTLPHSTSLYYMYIILLKTVVRCIMISGVGSVGMRIVRLNRPKFIEWHKSIISQ